MFNTTDIDAMWEADAARQWEEINKPDPNEGRYLEAAACLDVVLEHLDKALDFVRAAADEVEDLPEEAKVLSFDDEILDTITGLKNLANNLRYGW